MVVSGRDRLNPPLTIAGVVRVEELLSAAISPTQDRELLRCSRQCVGRRRQCCDHPGRSVAADAELGQARVGFANGRRVVAPEAELSLNTSGIPAVSTWRSSRLLHRYHDPATKSPTQCGSLFAYHPLPPPTPTNFSGDGGGSNSVPTCSFRVHPARTRSVLACSGRVVRVGPIPSRNARAAVSQPGVFPAG